jgi:hypothetical protein
MGDDLRTESDDLPDGPMWAAILSAGVGCATLGVLTLLAEVVPSASKMFAFVQSVGDLSGTSTLSLIIWIASWVALHRHWKSRSVGPTAVVSAATLLLIAIGLVGTFPPVADWLAGK